MTKDSVDLKGFPGSLNNNRERDALKIPKRMERRTGYDCPDTLLSKLRALLKGVIGFDGDLPYAYLSRSFSSGRRVF
jgi:hypothetical protein